MTTARGATLAAAVRVVDRVHRDAAVVRALAEPAIAARLAERDVHVVGVRDRAHRGVALAVHQALLAALMEANPRLIFDRAGRPAAVAAVREALPQLEQELFDAILEDCACELSATHEAIGQIVQGMKG